MKLLIDIGLDPVKIGLDFIVRKIYHAGKSLINEQKLKKQQQQMYVQQPQQQIPQQQ